MRLGTGFVCAVVLLTSACTHFGRDDSAHALLKRPAPVTEQDRISQCGLLSDEIAKQGKSGTDPVSMAEDPFGATSHHDTVVRTTGLLQDRRNQYHCGDIPVETGVAAASPTTAASTSAAATPAATQPAAIPSPTFADDKFDRCFKRCRLYTDRTKEQCFDICNK